MGQVVIAEDLGDADSVILENPISPFLLGVSVAGHRIPRLDRLAVAPERQRHVFVFVGQALEPLDGNEPVGLVQLFPERLGQFEIPFTLDRIDIDFENHRDHFRFLRLERGGRQPPVTHVRASEHRVDRVIAINPDTL